MAYFVPILNPINRLSFPVLVTLSLCAMAMDVLIHGSSLIRVDCYRILSRSALEAIPSSPPAHASAVAISPLVEPSV